VLFTAERVSKKTETELNDNLDAKYVAKTQQKTLRNYATQVR